MKILVCEPGKHPYVKEIEQKRWRKLWKLTEWK